MSDDLSVEAWREEGWSRVNVEGGEPGGHGSIPDDPQRVGASGTGAMTPPPSSTPIYKAFETVRDALTELMESDVGRPDDRRFLAALALIRQEYLTVDDEFRRLLAEHRVLSAELQQVKESRDVSIKGYADLLTEFDQVKAERDTAREAGRLMAIYAEQVWRRLCEANDDREAKDKALREIAERYGVALAPQEDKG